MPSRRARPSPFRPLPALASATLRPYPSRMPAADAHEPPPIAPHEVAALLDAIPGAIVLGTPEGAVRYVNAHFCQLFDLAEPPAALLGGTCHDLFVRTAARFADPDAVWADTGTLLRDAVAATGTHVRLRDGRTLLRDFIPVHRAGQRLGTLWVFRDVSAEARAHEEVARVKEFHERILENLPAQIAVLSPDFRYQYVSAGAIRDPETRAWIIGRTDVEYAARRGLSEAAIREREAQLRVAAGSAAPVEFDETITTRDGEPRHFRRSYQSVFDAQGTLQHVIGYGLDVTEHRRVEEQLRQAQKMEAVGRLAGGIAHDFNNLLTVILGFGDALREELDAGDDRHALVDAILEAGGRATALTRKLLDFSRRSLVEPRVLDLNRMVRETAVLLHRLLGEDVRLTLDLADPLDTVRADPGAIEQVLMNLAINARDAMPSGGDLRLETRPVHLEAPRGQVPAGRYVELCVVDTGTGMSEAVRGRIFEPFFTTKPVGKGTGLGLSTVYGIVAQSGGQLDVDSAPGRGTTFRVLLPAVVAPVTATPAAGIAAVPSGAETILVVEDDASVRRLVHRVLAQLGYTILEADDGEAALARSAEHPGRIDLLLTDVVMPTLGGGAVAREIRARRAGIKVLYMSGYIDDEVVRHGVESATDAFLQKPFTTQVLARRVREVLDGA